MCLIIGYVTTKFFEFRRITMMKFNTAAAGIAVMGTTFGVATPQAEAGIANDITISQNMAFLDGAFAGSAGVLTIDLVGNIADDNPGGNLFSSDFAIQNFSLALDGNEVLAGTSGTVFAQNNTFVGGPLGFADILGYSFESFTTNALGVSTVQELDLEFNGFVDTFDASPGGTVYTDFMNENVVENGFVGGDVVVRLADGSEVNAIITSGTTFTQVPAPGAVVLLGAAGLVASGRKRDALEPSQG